MNKNTVNQREKDPTGRGQYINAKKVVIYGQSEFL
jgi:hypothetical protein